MAYLKYDDYALSRDFELFRDSILNSTFTIRKSKERVEDFLHEIKVQCKRTPAANEATIE